MPRQKNERTISFQPQVDEFNPKNKVTNETISLIPEEVEAIYLMDLLGLYQEDAAIKMGVSRPTFARIIKSARNKLAFGILNGKNIYLQTTQTIKIIAFCTDEKENFTHLATQNQFLIICELVDNKIQKQIILDNPVFTHKAKPPIVLPEIFIKYGVNYFITDKVGEGFKNSLNAKGINIILSDKFDMKLFTS